MRRRQSKLPPNQVVGGDSFFKPKVQPKLAMGKPGDKYEVEADRMADQVVNKTGSGDAVQKMEGEEEVQQKPLAASVTPLVQKMESSEEEAPVQAMKEEEPVQAMEEEEPVQAMEEEEPVQAMEEEEPVQAMEEEESVQAMEEEEPVQAMEEEVQTKKANTSSTNSNIEGKLRKGSGGSKMDQNTKSEMESGFGADFSNVNIHDDSEAAQMSQNIGAQAFTHGNDVYFNKGKYNPDSKEGKHLLAHELTHTIQQKGMVQKKVMQKTLPKVTLPDDKKKLYHKTMKEIHRGVQNGKIPMKKMVKSDEKGKLTGFNDTPGVYSREELVKGLVAVHNHQKKIKKEEEIKENKITAKQSNAEFLGGFIIDSNMILHAFNKKSKQKNNPYKATKDYMNIDGFNAWAGKHVGRWYSRWGKEFKVDEFWEKVSETARGKNKFRQDVSFERDWGTFFGMNDVDKKVTNNEFYAGFVPKGGETEKKLPKDMNKNEIKEASTIGYGFKSKGFECIIWITPSEAFLECAGKVGDETRRTSASSNGSVGQWKIIPETK